MKTNIKIYLTILLFTITFCGCRNTKVEPNIEKAINDLTDKFTQLPKGKSKQIDFYKLIRTVIIGDKNIKLQLYSAIDSLNEHQQIILIINPIGKYYAIPFLTNTYFDYWNFEFDKPILNVKKTNTTFETEFIKALDTLNLNDSIETKNMIFNEIMFSLIQCERISESDSSKFESISLKNNNKLPVEDEDSCYKRQKRNFEAILKVIHPLEYYYNYCAYWDRYNDRIYQLDNNGKVFSKNSKFKIKVYRMGCNTHIFTL